MSAPKRITYCQRIRQLLLAGGELYLDDIAREIGVSVRYANAFLQHLRRRGEAMCVRRGDNGRFRERAAVWEAVPRASGCTEPDRARCPRKCQDFCNAKLGREAGQ